MVNYLLWEVADTFSSAFKKFECSSSVQGPTTLYNDILNIKSWKIYNYYNLFSVRLKTASDECGRLDWFFFELVCFLFKNSEYIIKIEVFIYVIIYLLSTMFSEVLRLLAVGGDKLVSSI